MSTHTQPYIQPMTRSSKLTLVLIALSLCAAGLLLFITKDGGLGVTPDSIHYLAASKSLLAGDVMSRFWWQTPFASWPPLYPTLLAVLGVFARAVNIDILEAARLAHTLFVGLIVFLSGCLFRRYLRSGILIVMGTVSVGLAAPLVQVSMYVWNETFYILLSLIFLLYLPVFLEERRIHQFFVLVILAAMGTLERYASIAIIPFGMLAIALFMQNTHWIKRWAVGTAFAISAIPYLLWLMYIRTLSIPTIGPSADPFAEMIQNFTVTPKLVSQLFVPLNLQTDFIVGCITVGILLTILFGFVTYFSDKSDRFGKTLLRTSPILVALYVVMYMAFYYLSHLLIYSLNIDNRHLSVMVPFLMLLIFFGLDRLAVRLAKVRWLYAAFIALLAIWFIYPASAMGEQIVFRQYWCCHGTVLYRDLPMIEWLKAHQSPGRYFSNTPIPLFYTPLTVYSGTWMVVDLNFWIQTAVDSNKDTYFIWFRDTANLFHQGADKFYYDYDPEKELANTTSLELVATFAEGNVYRVRSKN
ncbi:MAG: hypothetical protein ABI690_20320 [Chloroflexota bacterium]